MTEAVTTKEPTAPAPEVKTTKKGPPETQTSGSLEIENTVNQWVADHLHNSDFSRDTKAWNHFQKKLPALIAALKKEV